jgi:SAM-dependent methyltransferase
MEIHPLYGASVPERGWTPAPRYVLRRERVLRMAQDLPRGRLLEVGCGAGALLADLARLGFECEGMETSPQALELAAFVNRELPIRLSSAPRADWEGAFDTLVALEVLEHIEDDAAALRQWRGWLRPGGRLLLSVPARASRWSASDVWAGHFRRYEKAGLLALLEREGFEVERLECYGFPLSNLLEPVRAVQHRRILERESGLAADRAHGTARSGTERAESKLWRLQSGRFGTLVFRAAFRLQDLFLSRDLGTGYLVLARRP